MDTEKHRGAGEGAPSSGDTSAQVLPGPFRVGTKGTVGQGTGSCPALPGSGGCWGFLGMPTALGRDLLLGTPVRPGTSDFWALLSIIVCSALPDLPFCGTFLPPLLSSKNPFLCLVSAGRKSWELYRHLEFCVRARYCSGNEGFQQAD